MVQLTGISFCEPTLWIDRSGHYRARLRGEDVTLDDFTEHLEHPIAPLACWADLDHNTRRKHILEIIADIEKETEGRHSKNGTDPIGPAAVLAGDPHFYPSQLKTSPQPY